MLGEKFEIWLANLIPNALLLILGIHITNQGYLENGPLHFTGLPNVNMEEQNRILLGLDNTNTILDTNDKQSLDLPDPEAKQKRQKKNKAQRRQLRKSKLEKVTSSAGDSGFLFAVADGFLSHITGTSLSTDGSDLLFFVTNDALSLVTNNFLSIGDSDFLSAVTGVGFLVSLITGDSPSFTVFGGSPSSPVAGDGSLFTDVGGGSLSFVINGSPLSPLADSGFCLLLLVVIL